MACHLLCGIVMQLNIGRDKTPANVKKVDRIAEQILRYLESHPNATDTKYGIARWWLLEQRYAECLEETEQALKQLERKKLITKTPIAGGDFVYRYKPAEELNNG